MGGALRIVLLVFVACGGRTQLGGITYEDASADDHFVNDWDGNILEDASPPFDAIVADSSVRFGPRLALGGAHSCAEKVNGSVWCWGANGFGEVGDGTLTQRPKPVEVVDLFGATQLAANNNRTCAIVQGGHIYCWGNLPISTVSATPSLVKGIKDAIDLALGALHTCAADVNGDVWCWGINTVGQLGDGTQVPAADPVKVNLRNAKATRVFAGTNTSCALTNLAPPNRLLCWGLDLHLPPPGYSSVPVPIADGTSGVALVALGDKFGCLLDLAGSVRCWGYNQFGALGDGTTVDRNTVGPNLPLPAIATIVANEDHVCALSNDGRVFCWGNGVTKPILVTVGRAIALGVGARHACVQLDDVSVSCWGSNANGQLGDGTTVDHAAPAPVSW